MSGAFLAALVAGAVTIHLSEVSDLTPDESRSVVSELQNALADRLGAPPEVDGDASKCAPGPKCAAGVSARTGASEIIFLELYDAPSRIRVVASRIASGGSAPLVAEVDTERGSTHPELAGLAEKLFPGKVHRGATAATEPRAEAPSLAGPLVTFAAGGVALGAGVFFGAKSSAARDELARGGVPDDRIRPLVDEANSNALLGNLLFAAAGVLATSALLWVAWAESGS